MNYIAFGGLFRLRYAYIDSHNYAADSLFCRHKVPVKYDDEYVRDGEPYRIIICRIRRKYKEEFEKALGEISDKLALVGRGDYDEYCTKLMTKLKNPD